MGYAYRCAKKRNQATIKCHWRSFLTLFEMSRSKEMNEFIERLSEEEAKNGLSNLVKKNLEFSKKEFHRHSNISVDAYKEYAVLQSNAENVWIEAREKKDFSLFEPYVEKIIEFKRECAEQWG